ncbi:MAG: MFS transporter, partial [Bacteroidota bacterium]
MNSLKLILSNSKYFAPAWVFASLNIITGTWVLYLPFIKNKFNLDDSQVGMALFCLALGLLTAIPFIPRLNKRIGVDLSTKFSIVFYAMCFIFPLLAQNYLLLCILLFITGI